MSESAREVLRYVVNGIAATAIHYSVLLTCMEVLSVPSAGLANLLAAAFGIAASFLGSRYFVFRSAGDSITAQAARFGALYGAIAVLHGSVLAVWTDWFKFDYRVGFLIATGLQMSLSYVGNKLIVFRS